MELEKATAGFNDDDDGSDSDGASGDSGDEVDRAATAARVGAGGGIGDDGGDGDNRSYELYVQGSRGAQPDDNKERLSVFSEEGHQEEDEEEDSQATNDGRTNSRLGQRRVSAFIFTRRSCFFLPLSADTGASDDAIVLFRLT